MVGTLPKFSGGLKLVRAGVLVMLLQLVLAIVMAVKALTIDTAEDARSVLEWTEYLFIANIAAALAMFVGTVRAIPELRRSGVGAGKLITAAIGFAVAAAAHAWTYHVLSKFVALALNPTGEVEDLIAAAADLKALPYVAFVKDVGYWVGLISLIGMVRRSAIASDQLALRDVAGSMSRALMVMFAGDLLYQFTYGLGNSSVGMFGAIGSLIVLGYWIYCHVRLQRFLYNAAYFMNEPHNLPTATVLSGSDKLGEKTSKVARGTQPSAPRSSQPAIRPSQPPRSSQPSMPRPAQPIAPPPVVVVAPPPRVEPPRAQSSDGDPKTEEPRFLR